PGQTMPAKGAERIIGIVDQLSQEVRQQQLRVHVGLLQCLSFAPDPCRVRLRLGIDDKSNADQREQHQQGDDDQQDNTGTAGASRHIPSSWHGTVLPCEPVYESGKSGFPSAGKSAHGKERIVKNGKEFAAGSTASHVYFL